MFFLKRFKCCYTLGVLLQGKVMYPGAQPQFAKVLTTSFAAQSLTSTSKQVRFSQERLPTKYKKRLGKFLVQKLEKGIRENLPSSTSLLNIR